MQKSILIVRLKFEHVHCKYKNQSCHMHVKYVLFRCWEIHNSFGFWSFQNNNNNNNNDDDDDDDNNFQ